MKNGSYHSFLEKTTMELLMKQSILAFFILHSSFFIFNKISIRNSSYTYRRNAGLQC